MNSLSMLEKALISLDDSLAQPYTVYMRDSIIQRFEYSFEQSWKVSKRILEASGVGPFSSPKEVIRHLAKIKIIDDIEEWFGFLEARNLASHTYKEDIAQDVYEAAKIFAVRAKILLENLKAYSKA